MHPHLINRDHTYILQKTPENMNRQEERKCNQHPHSITKDREIMRLRFSVLLEALTFISKNDSSDTVR